MRSALVVAEFALAVVVLIGAGLIGNSLLRLMDVESGATAEDVVALRFAVPVRYDSPQRINSFADRLLSGVRNSPGVRAAALGMAVPPHRLVMTNPFTPEGMTYAPGQPAPLAQQLLVSPGFFETLGIRLVTGRDFEPFDTDSGPGVAIVNRALADRYLGGDAVGRWIQPGSPDAGAPRLAIVGVVDDVKYEGLEADVSPTIYVAYAQNTWWRSMYLVVRGGPASGALGAARDALTRADPLIPVHATWTVDELRAEATATPRFRTLLLGAFALLSLALTAVGIHGVMAYAVSQRRREAGIRMALGAEPGSIRRLVLLEGLRLALLGTLLGVATSALLARFTASFLFGVPAIDPVTYAGMIALLIAVAVVAVLGPAARATHADPVTLLRAE